MNQKSIYEQVKSEWMNLFSMKSHVDVLEIITPVATHNSKFVSVFVREVDVPSLGRVFFITDGKWLIGGMYGDVFVNPEGFEDEEVGLKDGEFYLATKDKALIPAVVFDMAHFIGTMVDIEIEATDFRANNS